MAGHVNERKEIDPFLTYRWHMWPNARSANVCVAASARDSVEVAMEIAAVGLLRLTKTVFLNSCPDNDLVWPHFLAFLVPRCVALVVAN